MGKIILEDIDIYAYHGHLPEEKKTGTTFRINLEISLDLEKAGRTDRLEDTFDYAQAYSIIKEEMKIPSSLLEHVAQRIVNRLFGASAAIREVSLRVSKLNPPFDGEVKAVSVELTKSRDTA